MNRQPRQFHRGRGRGGFNKNNSGNHHGRGKRQHSDSGEREQRPPGLRGKQIGLWYARRSKANFSEAENNFPSLNMNTHQARFVDNALSTSPSTSHSDNLRTKSDVHSRLSYGKCAKTTGFNRNISMNDLDDHKEDQESSSLSREQKPHNLRGKQLGLWFAKQGQGKMKAAEKNYPSLNMDTDQARYVDYALDSTSLSSHDEEWKTKTDLIASQSYDNSSKEEQPKEVKLDIFERYNEIGQSDFKKMFLKNIEANRDQEKAKPNSSSCQLIQNPAIDKRRLENYQDKQFDERYQVMMEKRKQLPSYAMREKILDTIKNNSALVISGETGCGKTTQVTQFILDEAIESNAASTCRIVCTQPRRISAITVAKRVSEERAERLGSSVGYQIRLESVLPYDEGSILYCTTGCVLQWLQSDPTLSKVSHLVIDEVHERDAISDFLICITKDLLKIRTDLKVILMSATLNAEQFSEYYSSCPMLHIPGLTYPVKEFYLEDVVENLRYKFNEAEFRGKSDENTSFHNKIVPLIHETCKGKYSPMTIKQLEKIQSEMINYDLLFELLLNICHQPPGAVLVFLTGWEEISNLHKKLESDRAFSKCVVFALHSMMPTASQKQVFERPPNGMRKIVLATNIAETSITIDDIVYVIDAGKIKMKYYNKKTNLSSLDPVWVTMANSKQRKGRAGRVQEGICYHMYTRARESTLDDYPLPEVQRIRLEEVILNVKILQLGLCKDFLFKIMQPPDPEVLDHSLTLLRSISALDDEENLTPLGFHLARLPIDPFTGKMLLMGAMFSCLSPILTIASALAFKDPFIIPLNKEKLVDERKYELADGQKSDHLLLSFVFNQWQERDRFGGGARFAYDNFLSLSVLNQITNLRKQFMKVLHEYKFVSTSNPAAAEVNINSDNLAVVKAIITAGLYPNVARIITKDNGKKLAIRVDDKKVELHPKSINCHEKFFNTHWLVYWQIMKTMKVCLYDATEVGNHPLLLFGDKLEYDEEKKIIIVGKTIRIKCSKSIYETVKKLRTEFDHLLEHKITHPSPTKWNENTKEGNLLQVICAILTEEHNDLQGDYDSY